MTEFAPLPMTIKLPGGLALFLYGMEKMTDGLKAAAGRQMDVLLARLRGNAFPGAITGAAVTAVIQLSMGMRVLLDAGPGKASACFSQPPGGWLIPDLL